MISFGSKQARHSVGNDLRNASMKGADNRNAHGLRLGEYDSQTFAVTGAGSHARDTKHPRGAKLFAYFMAGLGAAELAASFLPMARAWRPLLMIPAALMVSGVAIGFMEVRRGSVLVRAFAVAALLWLAILLGLGSVDPLTRTDYPSVPVHDQHAADN